MYQTNEQKILYRRSEYPTVTLLPWCKIAHSNGWAPFKKLRIQVLFPLQNSQESLDHGKNSWLSGRVSLLNKSMAATRCQLQECVVAVQADGDVVLARLHARLADGGEHPGAGEVALVALLHGLSVVRNGLKLTNAVQPLFRTHH